MLRSSENNLGYGNYVHTRLDTVHQVVRQVTAADWPRFVEKSALRADSFLARLSDDDFQRGMAALRTHGDAIDQNDAVIEEIDWFVFTRHDKKPGLLISPSSVR